MKTQLIMLPNPILVSDEQIEKEDWVYDTTNDWEEGGKLIEKATHDSFLNPKSGYKKIIAGVKDLPQIDFSALSEEDCRKIGWVDIEKLAVQDYKQFNLSPHHGDGTKQDYYDCFLRGFNAAQSLNEKKYSEEDVIKAIDMAREEEYSWGHPTGNPEHSEDAIIRFLSQPKVFDVQIQLDRLRYPKGDDGFEDVYRPKITNNSIKIIKLL